MPTETSLNPNSIAARIVNFLASLHGMDEYDPDAGIAAINLSSGVVVRPDAGFPDGEMVRVTFADAHVTSAVLVHTYKLVETLLVSHAQALAITGGGSAAQHYHHIQEHFSRKTGFGLE